MADEAGDLRSVLDNVPGFIVEDHVHEDVTREKLARGDFALSALAQFLHALDRHQHLADFVFHMQGAHALFERGLGLVARVRVHHVPLHAVGPGAILRHSSGLTRGRNLLRAVLHLFDSIPSLSSAALAQYASRPNQPAPATAPSQTKEPRRQSSPAWSPWARGSGPSKARSRIPG